MNDKCYSCNEEDFTDYQSAIETAIEGLDLDFEGETELQIFEGEEVIHKIGDFLPWIADGITNNCFEKASEYADSWILKIEKHSKEIQELVQTTLNNWADQTNNQPNFFGVKNVRPINVKIKVDEDGNWEEIS